MLELRVDKSINLKTKEAMFVKLPYNLEIIAKVKSLPKRFYIPTSKEWEVPVASIKVLLDMFSDQEIRIVGKVNTKIEQALENLIVFERVDSTDYKFKTEPFPHQKEGFEYAMANNKFLLGDEPGLGKTKQFIDAAVARKHQFKYTLVICGVNSLKWNWLDEIRDHSNERGHIIGSRFNKKGRLVDGSMEDRLADLRMGNRKEFFLIINIESLRVSQDKANPNLVLEELEMMCNKGIIGMVGFDEIHKASNPTSLQGKGMQVVKSYYEIAMTGMPLFNKPLDLYNIFKWFGEEKGSFYSFKSRYCEFGGWGGNDVVGYKNMNELRDRVKKIMLRRRKCEVLGLPEKIRQTQYVEMCAKQRQLYNEVRDQIKANIDKIVLCANPLAELLRLRQATGAPNILSSTITESAKMDRLEELVEELVANDQKVVIFSNWTSVTDVAMARLAKYKPLAYTGQNKPEENYNNKELFMNTPASEHPVLIGTIGAMGTGLTLTVAQTVIFLDKPWNPANRDQAEDRIHRISQTGTATIITLVAKDTIDEKIEEIIAEKGDIVDALIDGKMTLLNKRQLIEELLAA